MVVYGFYCCELEIDLASSAIWLQLKKIPDLIMDSKTNLF